MSAPAAFVLGVGIGTLIVGPLIGTGAVLLADVVFDWHQRRRAR